MNNIFGIIIFFLTTLSCKTLTSSSRPDIDDSYFNSSDRDLLRPQISPLYNFWIPNYIPFGFYYPSYTLTNYSLWRYTYPRPYFYNSFFWNTPFPVANQYWYWSSYRYQNPRNVRMYFTPQQNFVTRNRRNVIPSRGFLYTSRNRNSLFVTTTPRLIRTPRRTSLVITPRSNQGGSKTFVSPRIGGPRGGRNK